MSLLELFCHVDTFCQAFVPHWDQQLRAHRQRVRQRSGQLALSEIMTILILFHQLRFRDFKMFYLVYVLGHLHREFPQAVSYQRFVELMPSTLGPLCAYLQTCFGTCSGLSFVDATAFAVCHNRRISRHRVFRDLAQRGKTSLGWFYGFKLHIVINHYGELLACQLTPGNVDDRRPVPQTGGTAVGPLVWRQGLRVPAVDPRIISDPPIRRSATHSLGRPHGTAESLPREAWILVGTVPAIISHEQFAQVQAKLAQNQSFARRNNTAHQYLLRALVSCGHCQLACTARTENARNGYYVCNGKGQSVHSHRATPCPARYIPAHQLEDLVWQDVCTLLQQPAILQDALKRAHGGQWLPQDLQARRDNLRKARASLHQQLERLTDAYLRGVIPLDEYERRRSDLEQKACGLTNQAQQLAAEADRHRDVAGLATSIEAFCARIRASLANATFEQKRELVLLLIDRVIVTDGNVEIRYVVATTPASEHIQFSHLRKDYFHHPAARQQHKVPLGIRQFHDLQPAAHPVRFVLGFALVYAPIYTPSFGLHVGGVSEQEIKLTDSVRWSWMGRRRKRVCR